MGFFSKVRSSIGRHIGKARQGANYTIGKVRTFSQDIGKFSHGINALIPIVSEIVDLASDFIPGGSLVKTGLKIASKTARHISRFAEVASMSSDKASKIANSPLPQAVRHFRDLVGG